MIFPLGLKIDNRFFRKPSQKKWVKITKGVFPLKQFEKLFNEICTRVLSG